MANFYPYDTNFKSLFKEEKRRIKEVLPEAEIDHIGSTAVEGLGGKGIIDILVSIQNWEEKERAVKALKSIGFIHVHPEKTGRIFLSRRPETRYGDSHIHLVWKGNNDYEAKIFFRDYLRNNPEQAKEYSKIKKKAMKEAKGDRHRYAETKSRFVKGVLKKIK